MRAEQRVNGPATTACLWLLLAGAACRAEESAAYGPWDGSVIAAGTVTRVVTRAGAVWSGPARLVEELAIGVADGAEETMLGNVRGVAAHGERVYVIDASIPVVRAFDGSGAHLFDIGRGGQGPGEFEAPKSIGVAEDGRVFVRDDRLQRINVYAGDGRYLTTYRMEGGLMTVRRMVVTPAGIPYTIRDRDRDGSREMVPYGPDGAMDGVVLPPPLDFEPAMLKGPGPPCVELPVPYAPARHWAMAADGRIVAGVSDAYAFRVLWPDGSTLIVERRLDPVDFSPGEREYRRRYHEVRQRRGCGPNWRWNGPELPDHKPAYFDLLPVRGGGVWVLRYGPARRIPAWVCASEPRVDADRLKPSCWQDTKIVDAFDREGRYLGEVALPEELEYEIHNLQHSADLRAGIVVTPEQDRSGTIRIKKYRVVPPEP